MATLLDPVNLQFTMEDRDMIRDTHRCVVDILNRMERDAKLQTEMARELSGRLGEIEHWRNQVDGMIIATKVLWAVVAGLGGAIAFLLQQAKK